MNRHMTPMGDISPKDVARSAASGRENWVVRTFAIPYANIVTPSV
jgi:hypothetical protein